MRDGQHGRGHKPRQSHQRADAQHHAHHEQIQMIPTAFLPGQRLKEITLSSIYLICLLKQFHNISNLELVFLSVDDHSCDLLVHKDEDGAEESRNDRDHARPPRVRTQRVHKPPAVITSRLKTCWKIKSDIRIEYMKPFDIYPTESSNLSKATFHKNWSLSNKTIDLVIKMKAKDLIKHQYELCELIL